MNLDYLPFPPLSCRRETVVVLPPLRSFLFLTPPSPLSSKLRLGTAMPPSHDHCLRPSLPSILFFSLFGGCVPKHKEQIGPVVPLQLRGMPIREGSKYQGYRPKWEEKCKKTLLDSPENPNMPLLSFEHSPRCPVSGANTYLSIF